MIASLDIQVAGRLLLALILGGMIGWEREYHNKQAGFKTHMLVALGSCLVMLISINGFSDLNNHPNVRFDPARLAAQVVSGIGFLAGGAILVRPDLIVSGLTTAATLWVVMAIGLGIGSGFYFASILTTVLVLVSTLIMPRVENRLIRRNGKYRTLSIEMEDQPGKLGEIATATGQLGCNIRNIRMTPVIDDPSMIRVELNLVVPQGKELTVVSEVLRSVPGIRGVDWE